MRYTARKINDQLSRQGELWQSETFDHIVRSERQFEYLQSYIADNPKRANLRENEYLLWIRHSRSVFKPRERSNLVTIEKLIG